MCVCVCVCVCACVLDREGSKVFASRTPVVVYMAVYLTCYSDCLTGFQEPLLPPYRHHIGLKNVTDTSSRNELHYLGTLLVEFCHARCQTLILSVLVRYFEMSVVKVGVKMVM